MANAYDQFSTTSNKNSALPSVATRRTSINALLNPEPDERQSYNESLYQNNVDVDWYGYQNSSEDQSLMNQGNQNWRRYSAPSLISESNITNNNDLTIINYCNGNSSSQQSQVDSAVSQSMPTSPMSKHSDTSSSEYNGAEKSSRRSMSSSLPPSRRSSMNRASGSGQTVTSSNDNSNMITPPQTPGIKSPTKANFSFPPNSNGS